MIEGTSPFGSRTAPTNARALADRLRTAAEYVRNRDAAGMMDDLVAVAKDNPGPSLLVAGAIGFMVGRALTRD